MIHQQNLLKQYLFRNILFLTCPVIAISMYASAIDTPLWLKTILLTGVTPPLFLISLFLYFNGQVLTVSRSLLIPLYSMQVTINIHGKYNYVLDSQIRSTIKLISSSQHPLGFTLPDGSLLTPMTTVDLFASSISGTLLMLTFSVI